MDVIRVPNIVIFVFLPLSETIAPASTLQLLELHCLLFPFLFFPLFCSPLSLSLHSSTSVFPTMKRKIGQTDVGEERRLQRELLLEKQPNGGCQENVNTSVLGLCHYSVLEVSDDSSPNGKFAASCKFCLGTGASFFSSVVQVG